MKREEKFTKFRRYGLSGKYKKDKSQVLESYFCKKTIKKIDYTQKNHYPLQNLCEVPCYTQKAEKTEYPYCCRETEMGIR